MITFPIIAEFPSDEVAWILSIIGCALIGICMGLLSSFTTAIAGILGPNFIGPLMQGFSLSYVMVLPVRLLSLLALPHKDFEATILYFGINIAILTAMAISVPVFFRSKFIENHIPKETRSIKEETLISDIFLEKVTVGTIFKKAGVECGLLFMDFFISFILYPSIIYQKVPMIIAGNPSWSIFWINVAWACGDFPGRSFGRIRDKYSKLFLLSGNFLRLIFVFTTLYIALD